MRFPEALLENWMRHYYFAVDHDIGSSGVEDFSLAEIRQLLGFSLEELDQIVFHDSRTLGGPGLREAIAERWLGGDVDRVMATHGSTEASFLIMHGLLDAGDDVVACDPCYQQLYAIAEAKGCRLRRWPLRFEQGYRPDLEELERLLSPRTRMVIVNFPHNPTGASLTADEQRRLIEVVARTGAYLVWDAAFSDMTHGAPPLPDPVSMYERAISTGTLSKAYGLPGIRVGWCLAAPEVLDLFVQIRDYVTLHLSPLVEFIAERAVRQADRLVGLRLRQAGRNLELLAGWMAEHQGLVSWVPPRGGVTAFPRIEGVEDTEELCHRLARERRVLLVPGNCFGQPAHVRLGFGGSASHLERGLSHLSDLLQPKQTTARQVRYAVQTL